MNLCRYLFLLLVCVLVSCNDGGNDPDAVIIASSIVADKFGQETDRFVVGDDVVITVSIRNTGSISSIIKFTAPLVSIQIYSEDGATLIFDPNFGIGFPQVVQEQFIGSQSEITHVLTWRGIDNSGTQVSPARYQVKVRINGVEKGGDAIQDPESTSILLL